jgi:hypothetical protein
MAVSHNVDEKQNAKYGKSQQLNRNLKCFTYSMEFTQPILIHWN